jgi:monoamine oxidase
MASAGVGRYDDGTSEIPDGVVDPVERVIVIGAGIAGLTAANALTHAGVPCVVLEARDRIGGRLHTVDVGGTPVDLGGSWIHDPDHNPLTRFAAEVGVASRDGDVFAELGVHDPVDGRMLTDEEVGAVLELNGNLIGSADQVLAEVGADASAAAGIEAYLSGAGLDEVSMRRARGFLRWAYSADASSTPEETSLRWVLGDADYDLGLFPSPGYSALVAALAEGVAVRPTAVVASVEEGRDGVVVRLSEGSEERGSHVLVTVPLGVLRAGSIAFAPPLPPERADIIARVGFDTFEKVALTFDEPFWTDSGLAHLMMLPQDAEETAVVVLSVEGRPTLVFLMLASNVRRIHGPADDAVSWLLDRLSAALGKQCPQPVAVAVSDWWRDPYARGGFAHVRPGHDAADLDALGQPLSARVLFAGEATQSELVGFAHGAMASGIREAKRLLHAPHVELGPLTSH